MQKEKKRSGISLSVSSHAKESGHPYGWDNP
jgi:hypothetical protein